MNIARARRGTLWRMRAALFTTIFFALSAITLAFGEWTAVVLMWLAVVASAVLVCERTPREESRRFWGWAQLLMAIGLPVVFVVFGYFVLVAMGIGGVIRPRILLVPMVGIILASALALRRWHGVFIFMAAGVVLVWIDGERRMLANAMFIWWALASIPVAHLVAALVPGTSSSKSGLLRQFVSEVWATPKRIPPDACGRCGHDLSRRASALPCPQCGMLRPPVQ